VESSSRVGVFHDFLSAPHFRKHSFVAPWTHPDKHEFDVWVRVIIDDHGNGTLEYHMGVPGSDQRKAVFKASFKA